MRSACVHCGGPNAIVCNRCYGMVAYAHPFQRKEGAEASALPQLIDQLENYYDFESTGGPLKNCVEWQQLKALAEASARPPQLEKADCSPKEPCSQRREHPDEYQELLTTIAEVVGESVRPPQAPTDEHEAGCPANGGYGHGKEECICALGQPDAFAPTGWQPIATAPKDGTLIIGALMRNGKVWRVHDMKHNGLAFYTVAGGSLPPMTHWMPLPSPPDGSSLHINTSPWCETCRDIHEPSEPHTGSIDGSSPHKKGLER